MFRTVLLSVAVTTAGAIPAWQDSMLIASGGGEKGPWRQNASRYDYVDDPTVAFAPGRGLYLAWVDQRSRDVWFRRLAKDGRLGAPLNVARSPATFSWAPRIAVDPRRPRQVYLLWQEIIFSGGSHGGDILFARSGDGGASFAAPLNLSRSIGGDGKGRLDRTTWSNGSLDLAVGAGGIVIAAWTEYDGALWIARSTNGGVTFTGARRIGGDERRPARAPSLAAGPGRTVYLAWTVGEDPEAAIRVARSIDGGAAFDAPQLVAGGQGAGDAPRLAVDAAGKLHLAWAQRAGPGAPSAIRYALAPPGGSFGAARTLSAPYTDGGAAYPALASDGAAGLCVLWENLGADGRAASLGMTVSRDGGRSFSIPATVPGSAAPPGGSNGSQQGLLGKKLAVDSDGPIAVVNSSLVPGKGSLAWLMRGELARSAVHRRPYGSFTYFKNTNDRQ
jgi:hypothetical protein